MMSAEKAAGAVVVGVDGSEASLRALDWAAEQAVLEHRPLTMLHAASGWMLTAGDVDPTTYAEAMRAEGRAVVQGACAAIEERHSFLELRSDVILDDPRRVLLDASEHAYLLVVGSRGRGPIKSLLLGSVGVAVTHHAGCPVVVRRPHGVEAGGLGIVVGTDGMRHSEPAVDWAFHLAALRGMPLTLARTVFDGLPAGGVGLDERGNEGLRAQLHEVAEQFGRRHPPVEVSLRVQRGLPDEALATAASGMDMLVVGTHVRRSIFGLLDLDVTTRLVEHAPCYVAVVPGRD